MAERPDDAAINEARNTASAGIDAGSRWPGMSYEEGVENALAWVQGEGDEPFAED